MKLSTLLSVLSLWVQVARGQIFDSSSVKFVFAIARHGARSPIRTYPSDIYSPNDVTIWPEGPGELTREGKNQAYNVGLNLRQRYDDFLGPIFSENATRILSNLIGRTLMSAELLAAGLFPPVSQQIWNSNLLWQPIPIWPEEYDVMDVTNWGACTKFNALQDTAYTQKAFRDIIYPNKYFFGQLQNATGLNFANETLLRGLKYLGDALEIEKKRGLKLPDWATDEFLAKVNNATWKQFRLHAAGLPEMVQLAAGPLLKRIISAFESESRGKLVTLVTHDVALYLIAQAMGFTNFIMPDTAACMVLEIHKNVRNDNFSNIIQILYYANDTVPEPALLDMPVCRHPCPLSQFIDTMNKFILDDCDVVKCGTRSTSVRVLVTPSILWSITLASFLMKQP